ncbi:MAG TPA: transketolase C-terminal domain-containing protein [Syntrophorhabdaceae bacterium]|jgi:transketolase
MNMRGQLVETVSSILETDERLVLLLGDIGVWGFRNAFERFPERAYNMGILEQATVSAAAGLAISGLIPVFHTIAPFIVERSAEQLKIDFCYQGLGGNFISVGASYDYAALGCTHHCPADAGLLMNIPGMEIVAPGTSSEFDRLFREAYANGHPTYYRLSERENRVGHEVLFGRATVIRRGGQATVVAIGPVLDAVMEAVSGLDATVLYYTTVSPFDSETLRQNAHSGKVLVVEPFYQGTMTRSIWEALGPGKVSLDCIGVPRAFLTNYGTAEDHDKAVGLTPEHIRERLEDLIDG